MTFEEVSSAMVRLSANGLARVDSNPWRARCTENGETVVAEAMRSENRSLNVWKNLEKRLDAELWDPKEPIPHPKNLLLYTVVWPSCRPPRLATNIDYVSLLSTNPIVQPVPICI